MSCLATPLRFLPVHRHELQLGTVLKSGQSFRWHRSSPCHATRPPESSTPLAPDEEWSLGWGDRTVVLRQDDTGVHYRSLYPFKPPHTAYWADVKHDTTRPLLVDYFQLSIPLAPLYREWSTADPKFATKMKLDDDDAQILRGIRVLKQDEWETLVSFICSANNNIARITLMVNRLCAQLGNRLPHPSHFDPTQVYSELETPILDLLAPQDDDDKDDLSLYSFPPPELLVDVPKTESLLRELGFGYRANFIPTSAAHLVETARRLGIEPVEYLRSLRRKPLYVARNDEGRPPVDEDEDDEAANDDAASRLSEVRSKLLEFKGVGRKVADCVLLFGLGWSEVVPVDTHVFQIAIRDYGFPATKSTALSPAVHDKVSEHLAKKWQPHAGWCQQVLFFADLKPSPSTTTTSPVTKRQEFTYTKLEVVSDDDAVEEGGGERKKTFDEEVREIMENPARKRRRVTVIKTEKVEIATTTIDDEVVVEGVGAQELPRTIKKRTKTKKVKEEQD